MAKKGRRVEDDLLRAKHDIKALVRQSQADRPAPQKNIPYNILMGMRKKQRVRAEREETANREAQVLYNSFLSRKGARNPVKGGPAKLFSGTHPGQEKTGAGALREKKVTKGKAFEFREGVLRVSQGMVRRLGGGPN